MSIMDEDKKVVLPELPKPPADEKPEEGFVPYCGSKEAKQLERNPNAKLIVLAVLSIITILLFFISHVAQRNNYYQAVLQNLRFDYRNGEASFEDMLTSEPGSRARALSAEIGNQQIRLNTAMYMFDEAQNLQDIVSEYDYTHNVNEDILDVRTGAEKGLFMKSFTYRKSATGYQKKSGREWKDDPEAYIPKLNEYFFGTENHNRMRFACEQSTLVNVDGKDYTCELWLLEDNSGSQTVYTTIYRYYHGSRLAGVRILFDFDTIMQVYDIKNYIIG